MAWHVNLGSAVWGARPLQRALYVISSAGVLYAFNAAGCGAATCTPLWGASVGPLSGTSSTPAVAGGRICEPGRKLMFPTSGCPSTCPLWTASTGAGLSSSPAVANGVVYVGSKDDFLYAFPAGGCGAATCAPLWRGTTGGDVDSTPAVANGLVYVGSNDHSLHVFGAAGCGAATCAAKWTAATGGTITSSPAVGPKGVYVGSSDGKFWRFPTARATGGWVAFGTSVLPAIARLVCRVPTTGSPANLRSESASRAGATRRAT